MNSLYPKYFLIFFIISSLTILANTQQSSFPIYDQCDFRWSDYPYNLGPNTICQAGSLLCSVSMMLTEYNIDLNGSSPIPQIVNDWLLENNGFDGESFNFASINPLGFIYMGNVTQNEDLTLFIGNPNYNVILHIDDQDNENYYVLATGYNSTVIFANDPTNQTTSFDFDQILDAPVYYVDT